MLVVNNYTSAIEALFIMGYWDKLKSVPFLV